MGLKSRRGAVRPTGGGRRLPRRREAESDSGPGRNGDRPPRRAPPPRLAAPPHTPTPQNRARITPPPGPPARPAPPARAARPVVGPAESSRPGRAPSANRARRPPSRYCRLHTARNPGPARYHRHPPALAVAARSGARARSPSWLLPRLGFIMIRGMGVGRVRTPGRPPLRVSRAGPAGLSESAL